MTPANSAISAACARVIRHDVEHAFARLGQTRGVWWARMSARRGLSGSNGVLHAQPGENRARRTERVARHQSTKSHNLSGRRDLRAPNGAQFFLGDLASARPTRRQARARPERPHPGGRAQAAQTSTGSRRVRQGSGSSTGARARSEETVSKPRFARCPFHPRSSMATLSRTHSPVKQDVSR